MTKIQPSKADAPARRSRRRAADDNRVSLLDEMEADPSVAVELAAASLMNQFHSLLQSAFQNRPDISQAALAQLLHVSAGRVSQVLGGEENLRVSTVGRYARALGYDVSVSFVPRERVAPPLSSNRRGAGSEWNDLYASVVSDGQHQAPQFTISPALPAAIQTVGPQIHVGRIDIDRTAIAYELLRPEGAQRESIK
ncbi:hypothetical protein GCM10011399_33370 [Subtercola lobariae]|uniref:HTH cro/C1-type domain-containing protein n=1 Tax=Subtercola lobariae TaxID=1588641 RepID=A0A917BE19_9MICO|nr:hypothetical protein GCM10011399_33370 [Subtercola lobariae]